ncbi:hypothetical protein AB0B89_01025 [Sphaerisporangium sp. NPDC049002]|uniref:hypothetical protein n=1 Tax=Sphaerisporangium sp. NPDC049002 TaxID=3155392 RepID=UPI0033F115FF
MSGRARMTAVSAVAASIGLTGAVLLVTAPMTAPRANAAQVALVDPTWVEPGNPDITDSPADQSPEPEPTVTVTITESPDPTVTRTKTVDPKPTAKATKTPKPTATQTSPIEPPTPTLEPPPVSPPAIPTSEPLVPTTQPPAESVAPEPQVSLALVSPTSTPSETSEPSPSFDEPTPDSVAIEIRNASPEYNQMELSKKLAIPGVLLAVLVMLGVLIFEGRIRRTAHAAAVRRAGPRSPGRHRDDVPGAYPMPGYPIYHGGTAYAPIISFVPVQGYPGGPGVPYDPQGYGIAYEQGLSGPLPLAVGPSEPWPRREDHPHPGQGPESTPTFPAAGPQPLPGEPPAGVNPPPPGGVNPPASGGVNPPPPGGQQATLQAPLPDGKPSRGLLGRFRRGSS